MPRAVSAVVIAAVLLTPASAGAQRARWEVAIRRQLDELEGRLAAHALVGMRTGALKTRGSDSIMLSLTAGKSYVIAAVCDQDCRDVNLRLMAADGSELAADTEDNDRPLVAFTAPADGAYRVRVDMAACAVEPCYFGLAVYEGTARMGGAPAAMPQAGPPGVGEGAAPMAPTAAAAAFVPPASPLGQLHCPEPPTLEQIKTGQWSYRDWMTSASVAGRLGIPLVNVSRGRDYTVIVRDYQRARRCTAQDGTTELVYGQVARAVIELLDTQGTVELNLPAIAASATLQRKSQYFYIYKDGFYHPEIDRIIGSVSGRVFNVENYAAYQEVMSQMLELLSRPETQFDVVWIGIVPAEGDTRFVEAVAVTHALTQLRDGRSCEQALERFRTVPEQATAVRDTYVGIAGGCDATAPGDDARRKARQILGSARPR